MIRKFVINYALRHRHPANILLHLIGLPVTFAFPVLLLIYGESFWAAATFILGYCMQFIGHAIEGNDAGEVILVKRMLGLPYTDIVRPPNESSSDV